MPEMVTLVSVGGKIVAVPGTQLRITDFFSVSRVPWSENRSSIDVCVCVCLRGLFSGNRQFAGHSENNPKTQTRTRTHTHTSGAQPADERGGAAERGGAGGEAQEDPPHVRKVQQAGQRLSVISGCQHMWERER
jgi:hypothetical protein